MPEEKLIAEQTHIRCKIIIEILGKPKEHVEKTIRTYVDKIKDDSNLIVLKSEFIFLSIERGGQSNLGLVPPHFQPTNFESVCSFYW